MAGASGGATGSGAGAQSSTAATSARSSLPPSNRGTMVAQQGTAQPQHQQQTDQPQSSEKDNIKGSRIRVAVRIRPLLDGESGNPDSVVVKPDGKTIAINVPPGNSLHHHQSASSAASPRDHYAIGVHPHPSRSSTTGTAGGSSSSRGRRDEKTFAVDQVFDSRVPGRCGQSVVYQQFCGDLVDNAVEGYNVCVFAYGHTGTGKTYTMLGDYKTTSLHAEGENVNGAVTTGDPPRSYPAGGPQAGRTVSSNSNRNSKSTTSSFLPSPRTGQLPSPVTAQSPQLLTPQITGEAAGIVPRMLRKLVEQHSDKFDFTLAYYEVYLEKIRDLVFGCGVPGNNLHYGEQHQSCSPSQMEAANHAVYDNVLTAAGQQVFLRKAPKSEEQNEFDPENLFDDTGSTGPHGGKPPGNTFPNHLDVPANLVQNLQHHSPVQQHPQPAPFSSSPVRPVAKNAGVPEPKLKYDPRFGVYVVNISECVIQNVAQALKCIQVGNRRRSSAATRMNRQSSRSHAIIELRLVPKDVPPPEGTTANERGILRTTSGNRLTLVDLAGREQEKKIIAEHQNELRRSETQFINKSLFHLSLCISRLLEEDTKASKRNSRVVQSALDSAKDSNPGSERGSYSSITPRDQVLQIEGVPKKTQLVEFRNSRLTMLLADALTGNSKTVLMGTISHENSLMDDTLATLRFCSDVRKVTTKPQINANQTQFDLVQYLKEEVSDLTHRLNAAETKGEQLIMDMEKKEDLVSFYKFTLEKIRNARVSPHGSPRLSGGAGGLHARKRSSSRHRGGGRGSNNSTVRSPTASEHCGPQHEPHHGMHNTGSAGAVGGQQVQQHPNKGAPASFHPRRSPSSSRNSASTATGVGGTTAATAAQPYVPHHPPGAEVLFSERFKEVVGTHLRHVEQYVQEANRITDAHYNDTDRQRRDTYLCFETRVCIDYFACEQENQNAAGSLHQEQYNSGGTSSTSCSASATSSRAASHEQAAATCNTLHTGMTQQGSKPGTVTFNFDRDMAQHESAMATGTASAAGGNQSRKMDPNDHHPANLVDVATKQKFGRMFEVSIGVYRRKRRRSEADLQASEMKYGAIAFLTLDQLIKRVTKMHAIAKSVEAGFTIEEAFDACGGDPWYFVRGEVPRRKRSQREDAGAPAENDRSGATPSTLKPATPVEREDLAAQGEESKTYHESEPAEDQINFSATENEQTSQLPAHLEFSEHEIALRQQLMLCLESFLSEKEKNNFVGVRALCTRLKTSLEEDFWRTRSPNKHTRNSQMLAAAAGAVMAAQQGGAGIDPYGASGAHGFNIAAAAAGGGPAPPNVGAYVRSNPDSLNNSASIVRPKIQLPTQEMVTRFTQKQLQQQQLHQLQQQNGTTMKDSKGSTTSASTGHSGHQVGDPGPPPQPRRGSAGSATALLAAPPTGRSPTGAPESTARPGQLPAANHGAKTATGRTTTPGVGTPAGQQMRTDHDVQRNEPPVETRLGSTTSMSAARSPHSEFIFQNFANSTSYLFPQHGASSVPYNQIGGEAQNLKPSSSSYVHNGSNTGALGAGTAASGPRVLWNNQAPSLKASPRGQQPSSLTTRSPLTSTFQSPRIGMFANNKPAAGAAATGSGGAASSSSQLPPTAVPSYAGANTQQARVTYPGGASQRSQNSAASTSVLMVPPGAHSAQLQQLPSPTANHLQPPVLATRNFSPVSQYRSVVPKLNLPPTASFSPSMPARVTAVNAAAVAQHLQQQQQQQTVAGGGMNVANAATNRGDSEPSARAVERGSLVQQIQKTTSLTGNKVGGNYTNHANLQIEVPPANGGPGSQWSSQQNTPQTITSPSLLVTPTHNYAPAPLAPPTQHQQPEQQGVTTNNVVPATMNPYQNQRVKYLSPRGIVTAGGAPAVALSGSTTQQTVGAHTSQQQVQYNLQQQYVAAQAQLPVHQQLPLTSSQLHSLPPRHGSFASAMSGRESVQSVGDSLM
ncbi:unnamed protein product [Amoebophrya sp. A120]|nr:unnamed protein product [Amoebophrya sp. A120]|eukprot:GSA120T00004436001.1